MLGDAIASKNIWNGTKCKIHIYGIKWTQLHVGSIHLLEYPIPLSSVTFFRVQWISGAESRMIKDPLVAKRPEKKMWNKKSGEKKEEEKIKTHLKKRKKISNALSHHCIRLLVPDICHRCQKFQPCVKILWIGEKIRLFCVLVSKDLDLVCFWCQLKMVLVSTKWQISGMVGSWAYLNLSFSSFGRSGRVIHA